MRAKSGHRNHHCSLCSAFFFLAVRSSHNETDPRHRGDAGDSALYILINKIATSAQFKSIKRARSAFAASEKHNFLLSPGHWGQICGWDRRSFSLWHLSQINCGVSVGATLARWWWELSCELNLLVGDLLVDAVKGHKRTEMELERELEELMPNIFKKNA